MHEPDLKAHEENFIEDIKDKMYASLKNDKKTWASGKDIDLLVEKICDQYDSGPNALQDLWENELTASEASEKLIEYYDEFWDDEKNSGELEL
jgi:hypothetical protein